MITTFSGNNYTLSDSLVCVLPHWQAAAFFQLNIHPKELYFAKKQRNIFHLNMHQASFYRDFLVGIMTKCWFVMFAFKNDQCIILIRLPTHACSDS